jgi:cytochrome o ubiquinol oxidase subunit 3
MTSQALHDTHHDHDIHLHDTDSIDVFGFWIYILTDCILFATLFAAFAVMHDSVYTGPTLKSLFSLPYVLTETMFLLASSFTYGLAILGMYRGSKSLMFSWLAVTFLCGAAFIGMELNEFITLVHEGHSWQTSGALSSFFTLVGTHGCHVTIGLIWMALMMFQVLKYGPTQAVQRRLTYLGLFWHFLDIVWIFVFTIVYLMGAV